jgi:hypothetical protein
MIRLYVFKLLDDPGTDLLECSSNLHIDQDMR